MTMNNLDELVQWAKSIAKKYPYHRDEIWNFISLCQDEIEEGGSETHEISLCVSSISQLVGIDE